MKTIWVGLCLAFQFFSVLPIKRQLPMTRQTMTAMYSLLPVIGAVFGAILVAVYELLQRADVSLFFAAVILVVVHIICTGGLHLDGYVDVSDAFFSYGEREKRLEILEDPRTGAFGVISVVVLLLLQVAAVYELLSRQLDETWLYLLLVPVLLRCGVMLYFTTMKCAKTSGLAYYFSTNMQLKIVKISAVIVMLGFLVAAAITQIYALAALAVIQAVIVWLHRRFSYKHFGGMNGDLAGAIYEGSNALLWLTLLLFV